MIEIVVTPDIAKKVANKYKYLRQKRRKETGRLYPLSVMRRNIASALSINGKNISPISLRDPILPIWKAKGYKVVPYKHWFYAVTLNRDAKGDVFGITADAKYESDYYVRECIDSSEKRLREIITETILNL